MADGPASPFIRWCFNVAVQNLTNQNVQSLDYSASANVPPSKAFTLDSLLLFGEAGQRLRLLFDSRIDRSYVKGSLQPPSGAHRTPLKFQTRPGTIKAHKGTFIAVVTRGSGAHWKSDYIVSLS